MDRRNALFTLADATLPPPSGRQRYGLIGKMTARNGARSELIDLLLAGTRAMPGCLSYIVSEDAANLDDIWIFEAWDSKESHDKSLSLPEIVEAIRKAKPLIAGFGPQTITRPVGGVGLP